MSAASRPLRVAFVHMSDYHLDGELQRPARALAQRGAEVHAIGIGRRAALTEGDGRIHVHDVGLAKTRGGSGAYLREYASFLMRATKRVARLHARARLDLVQVHNMPDALVFAGVVPKLMGRPVILQLNDPFPELFATLTGRGPRSAVGRVVGIEERVSAALADALVVVTPQHRDRVNGRGIGRDKTIVVRNAPCDAIFGRQRAVHQWQDPAALRLVYHGGLAERYGVETLLRAFALVRHELPRATLEVFSQMAAGPEATRMRAIAPEGATVHRKPIDHEDIPALLVNADVGVVPMLLDPFTRLLLPVKLMEYIHMGLPAVVSDLPVVREVFGPSAVELVAPGDPPALARAIVNTARHPSEAAARARVAAAALEPLAWGAQVGPYLAMVDRLTARPRRMRWPMRSR